MAAMCKSVVPTAYYYYLELLLLWKAGYKYGEYSPYVPFWYTAGYQYAQDFNNDPYTADFKNTVNALWAERNPLWDGTPPVNPFYQNCRECEDPPLPHKSLPFTTPAGKFP
jgi:hypothetical protein